MTLEDTLEDGNASTLEESVEDHLAAEGGELHGEIDHTMRQESRGPSVSRRGVVTAMGAALAGAAGCMGRGTDSTPTETDTPTSTPTDTATETPTDTEEPTDTPAQDMSFEEIYMEEVQEPWVMESGREVTRSLYSGQVNRYSDPDNFDSFDDMMVEMKDDILSNFSVINDSQELTIHLQHAIHNQLDYDPSEVRVLGRDGAGGGTYTAIMHKNSDGDWVKDLALPADGDAGYLAHDDTEADVDFSHEASVGLWDIWKEGKTPTPATHYSALAENDWEEADEDSVRRVMEWTNKGNDHIVVDEPYEEPTVGYSSVEAAQAIEDIMNWHENDTFNEEMEMVEEATETWHNSEEPYIDIKMEGGEVKAVPAEEYTEAEEIYLN